MKVLHLFNEINFSGAEIMYAGSASAFQSEGIEMIAFSTGSEFGNYVSEFEKSNIRVIHHPIEPGINISLKTLKSYIKFYRFLKHENIDVLHIHRNDLNMVALISRIAKIRTIKTLHSIFRHRKHTYWYGYLQRLFARHLYQVKFHSIGESVYENELNYYKNNSIRINNWFDSTRFYPTVNENEKQLLRERLNIKKEAYVIISVGGCSLNKNHHDIVLALNELEEKSDLIYIHLGTGETENEEKELAKKLGLEDNIQFLGNKTNVRDYLVASDIYIMPSGFEGLGNSCLEAMACGLPSVLYNSPGLRDLINKNENGFLIEPNSKDLAEKITFLKENPEVAVRMGKIAIEFVNSDYSVNKSVPDIINLYRKEFN